MSNPWVVEEESNPWEVPETLQSPGPETIAIEAAVTNLPALSPDVIPTQTLIDVYRNTAALLKPTDERTKKSCAHFVDECKRSAKNLEAKRKALVDPLVKQQKEYNKEYGDPRDVFDEMARVVTTRIQQYDEHIRIEAELEQKRRNDAAEVLRLEALERERKLMEQAEIARAHNDEVGALKLEQQAEEVAVEAAEIVPESVALPQAKMELDGGGTLSVDAPPNTWNLPGWDKKKAIRVLMNGKVDHRIAQIVGDVEKLPEGVQFILQHVDLNPVHLNASYKGGAKFPKPFGEVPDYGKSTSRG